MTSHQNFQIKPIVLLMVGASTLAITGCQTASVNNSSDACYQYVQPLQQTQSVVQDSTVGGAVAGAVVGGLLGFIIGGDAKSAAIGAATGAGAGAVAGNQYGQSKSDAQRANLVGELNQMAASQSRAVGQAVGTISSLTDCRRREVTQIQNLAKSGGISNEEARRRLGVVKNKVSTDNRLIAAIVGDAQTRVNEYVKIGEEKGLEKETLVGSNDYSSWTPPEAANVIEDQARQKLTVKTGSRIRSGPSTSSSVLGSLASGDTIIASGNSSSQWTQFTYKGQDAFIFSDLVEPVTHAVKGSPASDSVTNRSMPAPKNEVQALAQNTAKVKAAKQGHQELSKDIDRLFAALEA